MSHKYKHRVFVDPLGNHGRMKLHSANLLLVLGQQDLFSLDLSFPICKVGNCRWTFLWAAVSQTMA